MKKFSCLLIVVSLALAGVAFAQQAEETPGPEGKKKGAETTTTEKPGKTHGEKAAKSEPAAKQTGATTSEQGATGAQQGTGKGHKGGAKAETSATGATGAETGVNAQTGAGATTETGAAKGHKGRTKAETSTATGPTGATGASASAEASATVSPTGKHAGHGEKATKAGAADVKASAAPSMTPATAASATAAPSVAASASAAPSVAASASAAPSVAATGAAGQTTAAAGGTVKADPQKVQQVKQQAQTIKQQHENFRAQPRPDRVPAVTFSANYRIQGSDRWSGPQYEVFRSYHPERRDRNWYHSRYQRIELIGGGYYYWNNGYWFPAWGYDTRNEYYAYDAPIYVGRSALPPDRVIASVQAELQQMGYYRGEVDGLLGPLTREALTGYQADQGLQVTAVIDEPTLDSLGMS